VKNQDRSGSAEPPLSKGRLGKAARGGPDLSPISRKEGEEEAPQCFLEKKGSSERGPAQGKRKREERTTFLERASGRAKGDHSLERPASRNGCEGVPGKKGESVDRTVGGRRKADRVIP